MIPGAAQSVSRGPGPAPMLWGEESDEQGVRFETKVLPPDLTGLESSLLFGVGEASPEGDGKGESSGLQELPSSAGTSVGRRRLSPRHRRAVREFFGQARKRQ